jgi:hypothetical protein
MACISRPANKRQMWCAAANIHSPAHLHQPALQEIRKLTRSFDLTEDRHGDCVTRPVPKAEFTHDRGSAVVRIRALTLGEVL